MKPTVPNQIVYDIDNFKISTILEVNESKEGTTESREGTIVDKNVKLLEDENKSFRFSINNNEN